MVLALESSEMYDIVSVRTLIFFGLRFFFWLCSCACACGCACLCVRIQAHGVRVEVTGQLHAFTSHLVWGRVSRYSLATACARLSDLHLPGSLLFCLPPHSRQRWGDSSSSCFLLLRIPRIWIRVLPLVSPTVAFDVLFPQAEDQKAINLSLRSLYRLSKSMWHVMWLQSFSWNTWASVVGSKAGWEHLLSVTEKSRLYSEPVMQTTLPVSWRGHRALCWLRTRVTDVLPFYHSPILSGHFQIVWDTQHYFNKFPFCLNGPELELATVATLSDYIECGFCIYFHVKTETTPDMVSSHTLILRDYEHRLLNDMC